MMSLREFVLEAINNGVQNDDVDVWVNVCGVQYTVSVDSVLGREEQMPFEASDILEENEKHEAWEQLYDQYISEQQNIK